MPMRLIFSTDSCREVIFAAMITCPYYSWTQPERGQQAKHNSIFVVYVHKDQQFFAPVNPHIIESSQVIDKVLCWYNIKLHVYNVYYHAIRM